MNEAPKQMFIEDQEDRRSNLWETSSDLMRERDTARLNGILEMIEKEELKEPADFLHAAMVLQHGTESRHYELAYQFAKRAADAGYQQIEGEPDPFWLAAAAKDRWLISLGRPQRYGTQFRKDGADSPWYLLDVDPSVTDEERAEWHVRPLAEQKKKVEELNTRDKK